MPSWNCGHLTEPRQKTEQVGWNKAKLSVPISDYKRIPVIITVERTDDNGTANSVRVRIHGDDFLLTGFTGRSLKLAIMRLHDVMESLQSEHLNQSDERAIRFH